MSWSRRAQAGLFVALAASGASGAKADEPGQGAVRLSAGYTADLWRNAAGGRRVANVYLDKTQARLSLDGARAFGWPGLRLEIAAFHTNSAQLSAPLVGDLHTVSNIDAPEVTALQEASIEQSLGAVAVKAGVVDLNTMFDVNEVGGLFVNSAHGIGPDYSQAGENGPSIFPMPGLAVSVSARAGEWTGRTAVFDGLPGERGAPQRQGFDLGDEDGVLYAAEVERTGAGGGRLLVGAWRHTGVAGRDGDGARAGRGEGGYVLLEPPAYQWGAHRLRTFARLGAARGRDLPIARYLGGGLVLEDWPRAHDQLGLALAAAEYSAAYRRGAGAARREVNLELTYRAQTAPWLAVQPNLQWISRPGGDETLDDAVVVGLRLDFTWSGELGL